MPISYKNASGVTSSAASVEEVVGTDLSEINDKTPALVGGAVPISDNDGTLTVDGTVIVEDGGGAITVDGTVTVEDGGSTISIDDGGSTVSIDDGGGVITVDGTVAVTGTFFQATQPVSAASLPLPSGAATAAKQPALGTAGTASTDVITVQGIASGTAQPVSDAGGSLTVDGTVAATQSGTWNIGSITTLPALVAGTAAIGKLAANSGVDIGDVDVTSFPTYTLTVDTITVTASAVQATTVTAKQVQFKARDGNAAAVTIGNSNITTSRGYELSPGASTPWFQVSNLNVFYVIGANTTDKVDYVVMA